MGEEGRRLHRMVPAGPDGRPDQRPHFRVLWRLYGTHVDRVVQQPKDWRQPHHVREYYIFFLLPDGLLLARDPLRHDHGAGPVGVDVRRRHADHWRIVGRGAYELYIWAHRGVGTAREQPGARQVGAAARAADVLRDGAVAYARHLPGHPGFVEDSICGEGRVALGLVRLHQRDHHRQIMGPDDDGHAVVLNRRWISQNRHGQEALRRIERWLGVVMSFVF